MKHYSLFQKINFPQTIQKLYYLNKFQISFVLDLEQAAIVYILNLTEQGKIVYDYASQNFTCDVKGIHKSFIQFYYYFEGERGQIIEMIGVSMVNGGWGILIFRETAGEARIQKLKDISNFLSIHKTPGCEWEKYASLTHKLTPSLPSNSSELS